MGVNKVVYNDTTLIDLTGDTVTADTLAEGVVAHDKRGETIIGTMKPSSGGENHITEVGVMIDGEPVTIRDDGSRLTTVVNDDSIIETRTFLDGTTETKTTVFNDDDTVTETTVADGKTTTKVTTVTNLGVIVMCTDNGNQVYFGESAPTNSVGKNGDVFVVRYEKETTIPRLDYIGATGTQFINTHWHYGTGNYNKARMVVESVVGTASNGWAVSGIGSDNMFYYGCGANGRGIYYGNGNTDVSAGATYNNNKSRFDLDHKNKRFIVTDLVTNTTLVNLTNITVNAPKHANGEVYLFAYHERSSGVAKCHTEQIYSAQCYENNTIIRDYVPVLDLSGTPCFYDNVSKTFEYNAGTGSFVAGNIIEGESIVIGEPELIDSQMFIKINGAWTLLAGEVSE